MVLVYDPLERFLEEATEDGRDEATEEEYDG